MGLQIGVNRPVTILTRNVWQADRAVYLARVRPWVEDRLRRRSRGQKHPVYDFLFEYYSFRPGHLMRWSPGSGVILEGAKIEDIGWSEFLPSFRLRAGDFPPHRIPYLQWAVGHLEATQSREASLACFGLHEWAMIFRDPNVRHPYVPLRLTRDEIDAVVDNQPLRCTHYDAFRFFTLAAAPMNRVELTRQTAIDHDQPGCVHANMDLYRFAYKIAPFCPSELLADAFELAVASREIDMRASPYDLRSYGFPPICIESREGREEYVERQREIAERARPIRERMAAEYRHLLAAVNLGSD
jgi:hypothetical protein